MRTHAGVRTSVRSSLADNTEPYRAWRYRQRFGGAVDFDQIEVRPRASTLAPAAILELKKVLEPPVRTQKYLDIAVEVLGKSVQGTVLSEAARLMRCPAYMVLWSEPLDEFHVHCLHGRNQGEWRRWDEQGYRSWLAAL